MFENNNSLDINKALHTIKTEHLSYDCLKEEAKVLDLLTLACSSLLK